MEPGSGKQLLLATAYAAGLIALCVWLGMAADSVWVGLLCFAGLIAIHVAVGRVGDNRLSNVLLLEVLGVWAISVAGTTAEYAGRWWWAVPWMLAGLLLLTIGVGASGKARWTSQAGFLLGICSLAWAVIGPVWLYGKSRAETRDAFTGWLQDWWWVALAVFVGAVVIVMVADAVAQRRRQRRWEIPRALYELELEPPFRLEDNVPYGQQAQWEPSPAREPEPAQPSTGAALPSGLIDSRERGPAPAGGVAAATVLAGAGAGATVLAGRGAGTGTPGELLYACPDGIVDVVARDGDDFLLTEAGRLVRRHGGELAEVPGVALYDPLGLGTGGDVVVAADTASQLVSVDYADGGQPRVRRHDVEDELACFALNPYGTIVAYASPGRPGIQAVLLAGGDHQVLLDGVEPTSAMAFSADGRVLALGGEDGVLRLFDMATREIAGTCVPSTGGDGRIVSLAECPGDGWVAGYASGMLVHWDAAGDVKGRVRESHPVSTLAVGARTGRVAVGCEDGYVIVHPDDLGSAVFDGTVTGDRIVRVMLEEDGRGLVAAGHDGSVRRTEV